MGLQLFSDRTWETDSFNETNVVSITIDLLHNGINKNKSEYKEKVYANLQQIKSEYDRIRR